MTTSFQRTRFRTRFHTVQAASSAGPRLRGHHPTQTPGRSERVNVHASPGGTSPGAGAAKGAHGHQQTMARRLPRPHLRGHGRSRSNRNPDPEWQDASSQAPDSTAQVSHTRPLPAPREGRQRRVLEGPPLPPPSSGLPVTSTRGRASGCQLRGGEGSSAWADSSRKGWQGLPALALKGHGHANREVPAISGVCYQPLSKCAIFLGAPGAFLNRRQFHLIPLLSVNALKEVKPCGVFFWCKQKRVLFECQPTSQRRWDHSLPGPTVHGTPPQARVLTWVPSPGGLPDPGIGLTSRAAPVCRGTQALGHLRSQCLACHTAHSSWVWTVLITSAPAYPPPQC